jgi:diacylglycerol O-acyltransferase
MQRLSGLDAAFLSLEVPSAPMHVASIIVLDPSAVEGGVGMRQLRDLYTKRVHLAPPFRRRLVEVPFGIHHPIWIEDPDFDLDFHLRHIAVPAPGTMAELNELAGHLVAMPLDRRRPLWEVWLIDGLENGNVALLSKVHHAAIDGSSGEELMIAILDLTPEVEEKPPPERPWRPDRVPTDTELFGYAAVSLAQNPIKMFKATRRTLEAAFQIRQSNRRRGTTPPPSPFTAPRTSFNHPLTPHRQVSTATLSLPEVKQIKNAFGVTVNDVILTICGAALRHYLDGSEQEVDRALVAMVPVSVRTEDRKGTMGNEVSATLTTLATDIDDPTERLLAVAAGMRRSKEQFNAIGADTLQNWTEFAAPALLGRAARLYSRMRIADVHRPPFNLTISNVPGPPFPLYVAGGLVKAVYPIGPIYPGVGLNITVMSYLDSLDFGINTCPELLPESWRLTDGLHRAVDELRKAAEAHVATERSIEPGRRDELPAVPRPDALPGTPIEIVVDEPEPVETAEPPRAEPARPAPEPEPALAELLRAAEDDEDEDDSEGPGAVIIDLPVTPLVTEPSPATGPEVGHPTVAGLTGSTEARTPAKKAAAKRAPAKRASKKAAAKKTPAKKAATGKAAAKKAARKKAPTRSTRAAAATTSGPRTGTRAPRAGDDG